jgi:4-deoxy-L-threo-5-hexosulose-uronate ketol-isomerase
MNTAELRASYLLDNLFALNRVQMYYVDVDRAVVGSVVPGKEPLRLEAAKELASGYFAERREVSVVNLGGAGSIVVDGTAYAMASRDGLYVGRGSRDIAFHSAAASDPAQFYVVSYPAHAEHPTTRVKQADAGSVRLGSDESCNDRTIYNYIHPDGVRSCQLVMGVTALAPGSVWNTMPCHTHARRSEIYLYFDLPPENVIVHLMGRPDETRHLIVRDRQAVIAPSWSIHSACGTTNYSFVWAMGGENQEFGDMDAVSMNELQ